MADKIIDFKTASNGSKPVSRRNTNPIIGISVNIDSQTSRLHEAYINSVLNAGGIPVLIPAKIGRASCRERV